jgi:hypothetical protein
MKNSLCVKFVLQRKLLSLSSVCYILSAEENKNVEK